MPYLRENIFVEVFEFLEGFFNACLRNRVSGGNGHFDRGILVHMLEFVRQKYLKEDGLRDRGNAVDSLTLVLIAAGADFDVERAVDLAITGYLTLSSSVP